MKYDKGEEDVEGDVGCKMLGKKGNGSRKMGIGEKTTREGTDKEDEMRNREG